MTRNEPQPGDTILYYGYLLEVKGVEDKDGYRLVRAYEQDAANERAVASDRVHQLRLKQDGLRGEAYAAACAEIATLDRIASSLVINVRIRLDYVSWWPQRGIWACDGRIFNARQLIAAGVIFDNPKPQPHDERAVYDAVNNLTDEQNAIVDEAVRAAEAKVREKLIAEHTERIARMREEA